MRPRVKQIFPLLLCFALLAHACSKSDQLPGQVLPVSKMSAIMLDLQLAKSYNYSYFPEQDTAYPTDRKKRLKTFYHQIFQLHHTDTATFFSSFRYYASHPDWLKKVYKSMQDSLESKMARQHEMENKRRKAEARIRAADKPTHPTSWQQYFKAWHAFSDSIHQQASRAIYPFTTE